MPWATPGLHTSASYSLVRRRRRHCIHGVVGGAHDRILDRKELLTVGFTAVAGEGLAGVGLPIGGPHPMADDAQRSGVGHVEHPRVVSHAGRRTPVAVVG